MKKIILFVVVAVLALGLYQQLVQSPGGPSSMAAEIALQNAFANRESDIQVKGAGKVTRVLSDDLEGSRHQRFIVMLGSGDTLLISHNIDLAPRVANLKPGDVVEFYGEYEWNEKGGVVHWTHHDPNGRHVGGWIKHLGNTYQ